MRNLADRFGVDEAVFLTLFARSWTVGGGILTILFITHYLTPELQGYYYTFYSLIALQLFAELGLNFAIVQFASHEMAAMDWTSFGTVSGSKWAKRRLQSLMQFTTLWFAVAGLLMVLVLIPLGIYLVSVHSQSPANDRSANISWSLLVICAAANLLVSAAAAFLEGCGRVVDVAALRLRQSLYSIPVGWAVLFFGGRLYALPATSFALLLVGVVCLWRRHKRFFYDLIRDPIELPGMNWRKEIWPFQWRIAASWMSGFLVFQLFNPFLFATHGPVLAGQMGMSMQIYGALNGAAMAWITTKMPLYGRLIATNKREELDKSFFRALIQSSTFLIIGIGILVLAYLVLLATDSPYLTRLLPFGLLALLGLSCVGNHIVFAEAAYLRAHKQEPFLFLSIVNGLATALLAVLVIPRYGAAGAVGSYVATAMGIGLLFGTIVFQKKRSQWHLAAQQMRENVS